ncbi:MAG: hypothetical protein ABI346_02230 [Candidatus Baltobacteraceae bacterium]
MKIPFTAARLFLGLAFTAAGLAGLIFVFLTPPPAPPGLAGTFQQVFFQSHWAVLVNGVEFVAGAAVLFNRYLPLGLVLLAAVLTNILTFHLTMNLSGIIPGAILSVLWFVVALPLRAHFAPLLVKSAQPAFASRPRIDESLAVQRLERVQA